MSRLLALLHLAMQPGLSLFQAVVIIALIVVAVSFTAAGYMAHMGFLAQTKEHKVLVRSQNLTSCVLSLSDQERITLRKRYTEPNYLFVVCPWLEAVIGTEGRALGKGDPDK